VPLTSTETEDDFDSRGEVRAQIGKICGGLKLFCKFSSLCLGGKCARFARSKWRREGLNLRELLRVTHSAHRVKACRNSKNNAFSFRTEVVSRSRSGELISLTSLPLQLTFPLNPGTILKWEVALQR
jgi:hypothetical protein